MTLTAATHVRMLATLAAAKATPMKDKLTLRSSTRKAHTNVAPAENSGQRTQNDTKEGILITF